MRHTRRRSLNLMSGLWAAPIPPRGGWHRNDPGDDGDGTSGHSNTGGDNTTDTTDTGDDKTNNGPKITGEFDPDRAQRALAAARDGEKKAKQAAKDAADRLTAVLKAAGLTADGKADPEQQLRELTDRATKAEQRAAALATREAVRDAATAHAANAGELLDSSKFLTQLGELDPTATDYADKVGDLVKKAVKDNPARFGTTPAKGGPGRSGSSDHTGGGHGPARPANLESAVARKLAG